MRPPVTLALALLLTAALTACTPDQKSGDERTGPADPVGTPASAYASPRLKPGQPAIVDSPDGTGTVLLANVRNVKAPADWAAGVTTITVADVTVTATRGRVAYSERDFALYTATGTRVQAPTVASDQGLPGTALGSGQVTAPDKVTGLVTFEYAGPLAGCRIETADGAIWDLT